MSDTISKEAQIRALINQKFVETGEKERIRDMLRAKLTEGGWREEMRSICREYLKTKGSDVTLDDLVADLSPKARNLVPDAVKQELNQRVRKFLAVHAAGSGAGQK